MLNQLAGLQDLSNREGNWTPGQCIEVMANPGNYRDRQNEQYIDKRLQHWYNPDYGQLTTIMCPMGYYLSGLRNVAYPAGVIDRFYCCPLRG